jgi:hypothetical protein
MKVLKDLPEIAGIFLILSLVLLSCRTVEKAAVLCPEFLGNKNNKVSAYKVNRTKKVATHYRITIRKQSVSRHTILSRRNHGKDIAVINNSLVHENIMISGKEYLKDLSKIEYLKGLTASSDNAIILSRRNDFATDSIKKRDTTEQSKDFISTQQSGCDTIFLKSGPMMIVKVTEIRLNEIMYKNCNTLNGPIASIPKSEVLVIKSANGKHNYSISADAAVFISSKTTRINEGLGIAGFILGMINPVVAFSMIAITPVSLAWLAIILGFSALGLIVFILGCISLRKIKRHPDKYKGKGFAAVSIILGLIGIIAFIILFWST